MNNKKIMIIVEKKLKLGLFLFICGGFVNGALTQKNYVRPKMILTRKVDEGMILLCNAIAQEPQWELFAIMD